MCSNSTMVIICLRTDIPLMNFLNKTLNIWCGKMIFFKFEQIWLHVCVREYSCVCVCMWKHLSSIRKSPSILLPVHHSHVSKPHTHTLFIPHAAPSSLPHTTHFSSSLALPIHPAPTTQGTTNHFTGGRAWWPWEGVGGSGNLSHAPCRTLPSHAPLPYALSLSSFSSSVIPISLFFFHLVNNILFFA